MLDLENSRIDPSSYPKRYYYFSSILNEEPIFEFASKALVIFSYVQCWLTSYTPIILDSTNSTTNLKLIKLLYAALSYVNDVSSLNYSKFYEYISTLFFIAIAFTTFILYLTFSNARHTSRPFLRSRGLLFLFVPNLFFYQKAIFVGVQLQSIDITDSPFSQVFSIVFELVILALILSFTILVSPIIFKNPVLSRSCLPTRLFPDFQYIFHGLVDAVYITLMYFFQIRLIQYFLTGIFAVYSIYDIIHMFRHPFVSHGDTSLAIGADATHILILPFCIAFASKGIQNQIFFYGFAVFLIAFGVSYGLLEKRSKTLLANFNHSRQIPIDDTGCLNLITEAVLSNMVSKELIQTLEPMIETSTRLDLLSCFQFLKIIAGETPENIFNTKHILLSLNMCKNVNEMQRYFIFELIHALSKQDLDCFLPQNNELITQYQIYQTAATKFWDYMIRGKLKQGMSTLIQLNKCFINFTLNFQSYHYFFSNNDMIKQLKTDFIDNVTLLQKNDTFQTVGFKATTLHYRYAAFIQQSPDRIVRKFFGNEEIEDYVAKQAVREINFKSNIRMHVKKPLTKKSKFIFSLDILVYLVFLGTCIYYPISIKIKTRSMNSFIDITLNLANISEAWQDFSLTIGYSTNQTLYDLLSLESMIEVVTNNKTAILSIETLLRRMNSTIENVVKNMRKFLIQNSYFSTDPSLSSIRDLINDNIIDYQATENTTTEFSNVSAKSMTMYYSLLAAENIPLSNYDNPSNSTLVEEFKNRAISFSVITLKILNAFRKCLDDLDKYSSDRIGPSSISSDNTRNCIFILFITLMLDPFVVYWFRYSSMKEVSEACEKYFRPKVFEEGCEIEEFSKEVEEFSLSSLIKKISWSVGVMIVYCVGMIICWELIYDNYYEAFAIHNTIIGIQRMQLQAAITLSRVGLAWKKNASVCRQSLHEAVQYFDDIENYCTQFNRTYINAPQIYNETHTIFRALQENISFHDYYQTGSLGALHRIIAYITHHISMNISTLVSDPAKNAFHIYFQHTYTKSLIIWAYLYDRMNEKLVQMDCICNFAIFSFVVAILILPYVFWSRYVKTDSLKMQLGRLILDLDPIFITKNQCLVEYIIGSKTGVLPWENGSPIFDILNSTNTPFIIINDHNSILAFSRCISEMFSYQPEQLIGQHYTMLFMTKGEPPSKAHEFFFSRISDLLTMSSGCTSKIINGVTSEGVYIKLDIHACVFVYDDMKYVLFHLENMGAISDFEEATTICQQKIIEMYESSIPLRLFPPSEDGGRILSRKFFGGTIVYCALDGTDIVRSQTDQDIGVLEKISPLFCGNDDAIILSSTGSYTLIVYGNSDNTKMHRVRALKFIKEFLEGCRKGCTQVSVMLDIDGCFEVVQSLPPPAPKQYDGKEIPAKESNQFSPWMTTDPFINKMSEFGSMLSVLRPNIVIMQQYLSEPLERHCKIMPVTLVNTIEKFVGIAIDELPDPYVMMEEVGLEAPLLK